jgi:hypothetical protein
VTRTSPPAPRLVSAAAAGAALLKRTELGEIIGDTDLRQVKSYTKPSESGEGVQPRDCAPRLLFSEAVAAAGYQAAVGASSRGARGQSAAQLITVFTDREQPARVVGDLGRMVGYCAEGESFSTTAGDATQQWIAGPAASDALGPVSGATRAGGGAQRQEAPPRNCLPLRPGRVLPRIIAIFSPFTRVLPILGVCRPVDCMLRRGSSMRAMIRSALAFRAVSSVSSNSLMTRSRTVATWPGRWSRLG